MQFWRGNGGNSAQRRKHIRSADYKVRRFLEAVARKWVKK